MRISRFTAYHVRIPLKKTIKHASHSRTETDSIIVRCTLDDGTSGWGEGLPREYVTGETIDDVLRMLVEDGWPRVFRDDFETLADTIELCEHLNFSSIPGSARPCFGNSLRCAIELSVLDAACRRLGVPLSAVVETVPETLPIRNTVKRVRYSTVMTAESPRKQWQSAIKYRLYGFSQIKVKVGMAGSDDAATLRRVRRVMGKKVRLRIDANEAWSPAEVPRKLAELERFGIDSVEQPVPHREVNQLAEVRRQTPIPVMLDESLCDHADAARAIEHGLCDVFNIRLSKCGGMVRSLRLAAMAHQAGLGYQLGCQVGETGILSATGRHFATSVAKIRSLEGSYDRHLLKERITREDLTFGYGGAAPALDGAGLGVTIDEDSLLRTTVRQLSIECK